MKTYDTRCLSPDAQEALRFRVVRAIRGGMKKAVAVDVAQWLDEIERQYGDMRPFPRTRKR